MDLALLTEPVRIPNTGPAPLTVTFYSGPLKGQEPHTFAWDFRDGTTSSEQNPVHTYPFAGYYNVTLRVTDADGLEYDETVRVDVSGYPKPRLHLPMLEVMVKSLGAVDDDLRVRTADNTVLSDTKSNIRGYVHDAMVYTPGPPVVGNRRGGFDPSMWRHVRIGRTLLAEVGIIPGDRIYVDLSNGWRTGRLDRGWAMSVTYAGSRIIRNATVGVTNIILPTDTRDLPFGTDLRELAQAAPETDYYPVGYLVIPSLLLYTGEQPTFIATLPPDSPPGPYLFSFWLGLDLGQAPEQHSPSCRFTPTVPPGGGMFVVSVRVYFQDGTTSFDMLEIPITDTPPPQLSYLSVDGTSRFLHPDGTSVYLQP